MLLWSLPVDLGFGGILYPMDRTPVRRATLIPAWLLPTVVATLSVAAVVAGVAVFRPRPVPVGVPSVTGLPVPVARSRLAEVGLLLERGVVRFSATVAADGVVTQRPEPGDRVAPGSVVVVDVSGGSETFSMPDVVGKPLDMAKETIAGAGMRLEVEFAPSDQPTDTVLASLPSAGVRVTTSDVVRLTVASGSPTATVLLPISLDGLAFAIDPSRAPSGATDVTMDVARRLRALLEASGARVTVIRGITDTVTTDATRLSRVRSASPTAVLSMVTTPARSGGIVLSSLPPSATAPGRYLTSVGLARAALARLRDSGLGPSMGFPTPDRVLTGAGCAVLLVRLGSFEVTADVAAFRDPRWEDELARALYQAVGDVFGGR